MAVPEDFRACERAWGILSGRFPECSKIIACSPIAPQVSLLRNLFPKAEIVAMDRIEWNLGRPCPVKADLVVACNVFHYSDDPEVWFRNTFAACKQFWMQDLFSRQRGSRDGNGIELGNDGDRVRYSYGGSSASVQCPTYDLGVYQGRLLYYELYDAGSTRDRRAMVNFVAAFRGDL